MATKGIKITKTKNQNKQTNKKPETIKQKSINDKRKVRQKETKIKGHTHTDTHLLMYKLNESKLKKTK